MTKASIYLEKSSPTATIVLNKPERRNALDLEMWRGLLDLLDQIENDSEIRVGFIRGVDERAFASGADITEFGKVHSDPKTSAAYSDVVHAATRRLTNFPKPMIAVIQGPCVGGACAIALACDMRIADETSRFGVPPSKLGLVYSLEDTKLLMDAVGVSRARDLLYTGRLVESGEALSIGLINRLVTADEIDRVASEMAENICAVSQFSVRQAKVITRLVLEGATDDTPETRKVFHDAFQGEDYKEGTAAFIEKRKPNFPFS